MVQQCGEPLRRPPPGRLPYPLETAEQVFSLRICTYPRLHLLPLSLRTGPVGLNPVPLGQGPSLHPLRRSVIMPRVIAEPLFDGFSGTVALSDCSTVYMGDYGLRPSPAGLAAGLTTSHCRALSAPVHGAYAHAAGL